ncbi:Pin2/trf1-interacting protein 1 [Elysia marginata]|uniref:Pin2/trf1-interacting protein 1 n=1 Tax=Elysia marginata TaxID=1093978 RepID=A0AAV4GNX0_9GAST|nr:Pin2/trf1-interacting protein 1 [Elysia marginata]
MALLAEGKKKVKYGLDPQNTQWSNDTNKFGQRLMEKMGWEKGKGLGANENGMTEHIKASYKWDQSGLGASPQSADAWVAHQDDFNDLLKMLNSGNQDETPEEKDQTQQAKDGSKRYYGRFARGRVQKLRTTEDLDCIFGRRKTASAPTTPSNQSAANSDGESDQEDGATENSHGLTTVTSTTSVQDYFANKMREMKARQMKSSAVEDSKDDVEKSNESGDSKKTETAAYGMVGFSYDDSEKNVRQEKGNTGTGENKDDEKPSRGWYQNWNAGEKEEEAVENEDENSSKKSKSKKKKKNKKARSTADLSETPTDLNQSELTEQVENPVTPDEDLESSKSSKKKKKRKAEQEAALGVEVSKKAKVEANVQSAGNVEEPEEKDRDTLETSEPGVCANESSELNMSSKKKKKRKAEKELGGDENEGKKRKTCTISEEDSLKEEDKDMNDSLQVNTKSKKKKKKDKSRSEPGSDLESRSKDLDESRSNIEELNGYGELKKVVPKKEVTPEKTKTKKSKAKKEKKRKLFTARDVGDKLRDIAKLQGGQGYLKDISEALEIQTGMELDLKRLTTDESQHSDKA